VLRSTFRVNQCSGKPLTTLPIQAVLPISPLAEDDKTVMITLGVSTKSIRESGDYIFTLLPSVDSQSIKMSEFLAI
jgi:ABC-type branched-subunit amino acid transport system substrate-binding protein